ncbi:MAG: threonine--tRNA ligase [Patescibacteria group bacterium]
MAKTKAPRKPADLEPMRHSLAHVLAMAVLDMFPEAKLGIGPATDDGFYYDFDLPRTLIPEDLPILEQKMRKIMKRGLGFEGAEVRPKEAIDALKAAGQPYKVELAEEFAQAKEPITFYKSGDFTDLCRGGHVKNTKEIPKDAFALERIAGAYWRGDEQKPQLQRIYGVAFGSKAELDAYRKRQAQAKERDHRKLGKELGLYITEETVGAGLPIFTPKGTAIWQELLRYLSEQQTAQGYQFVVSPHIARKKLFEISGHWEHYRESMFAPIDIEGEEYLLRAMNCPFHVQVFRAQTRSYRELPIRLAEVGTVYRYEQSGEISGLTRVRSITQDDAHIFCTPDQILDEFTSVLSLVHHTLELLGMQDYQIRFGKRDPESDKYLGSDAMWQQAERDIAKALDKIGADYFDGPGDAAFYGPKLDFVVKDVLGREWQLGTVQLDYFLPERFGLEYAGEDGDVHRPVMIHRAPFGSLQRFIGILIEHFAGAFPLWLAPEQARVLPIADRHNEYAASVAASLREAGLRVSVDDRAESVGKKIREAEVEKTPYMLVVGDKEAKAGSVALRSYHRGDLGVKKIAAVTKDLAKEATDRVLSKTF